MAIKWPRPEGEREQQRERATRKWESGENFCPEGYAVKLFCAAGFCRKWTAEEPYPPLPAIFRIRGFDTGRGLGVNSAGPQDLGGGYLLLLHLILFLYSYSYKV